MSDPWRDPIWNTPVRDLFWRSRRAWHWLLGHPWRQPSALDIVKIQCGCGLWGGVRRTEEGIPFLVNWENGMLTKAPAFRQ